MCVVRMDEFAVVKEFFEAVVENDVRLRHEANKTTVDAELYCNISTVISSTVTIRLILGLWLSVKC